MIPRSICSPPDQASSSSLIRKAATCLAMSGELLLASEEKVRMLRDRLSPGEVVELHAEFHAEEASAEHDHDTPEAPEMEMGGEMDDDRVEDEAFSDETLSEDTEYVDDPQIDLLSA